MHKSVVLNLGQGNLENGFPFVTALLEWDAQKIQVTGSLAPAPQLIALYERWQLLYNSLYKSRFLKLRGGESKIVIEKTGITNVSDADFHDVSEELQNCLNDWLSDRNFNSIQHQLRNQLSPHDEIRLIVQTEDERASQIPWYVWQFFQDYPQAEIALSTLNFKSTTKVPKFRSKVRILAILGDTEGIDIEADRYLLENLANAETVFLVQPTSQELNEQLWSQEGWDILFFAGHSFTDSQKGKLYLNPDECITLTQLKNALQKAIANGLQLAIFNSCEGLGLAYHLADLNIPQTIVMREPVPDRVAQEFLKHFLLEFAGGRSFFLAVREAREKLQGIETEYPGASWLPVTFQNPATTSPTWAELSNKTKSSSLKAKTVLVASIIVTTLIGSIRWCGGLQAPELKAFDLLTQLMPAETVDDRILIIGADERDLSKEGYGYPLPDSVLAKLLDKLEPHQPVAIGIDLFRDKPLTGNSKNLEFEETANNKAFKTHLQQNPNIITVCTGHNLEDSIPLPPGSSLDRGSFADLYNDLKVTNRQDYTVRRYSLSRSSNPISKESRCRVPYSFALQLAYRYFQNQKIPVTTTGENWQIGSTVIKRLQPKSGGYQKFDSRGNQLLIRYRNTPHIARQITVREVLSNKFDPAWVKNRIVLIGVTAATVPDFHDTPQGKLRGLQVHAHVISQLFDAVNTKNSSLFWWLPQWGDMLWIWFWSGMGGITIWIWQSPMQRGMAFGGNAIALYFFCWFVFTKNGWLPLIPGALALFLTGGGLIIYAFWRKTRTKA
jgi:CHASE2 domain-containing sensor protein